MTLSGEERDYIMLSDRASSAKYVEVKEQPKIKKDEKLQTEEGHKPATQQTTTTAR